MVYIQLPFLGVILLFVLFLLFLTYTTRGYIACNVISMFFQ